MHDAPLSAVGQNRPTNTCRRNPEVPSYVGCSKPPVAHRQEANDRAGSDDAAGVIDIVRPSDRAPYWCIVGPRCSLRAAQNVDRLNRNALWMLCGGITVMNEFEGERWSSSEAAFAASHTLALSQIPSLWRAT